MTNVLSSTVRMSTPDDMYLEAFDNTKLVAMNTCPTWGILRYQMHKTFPNGGGRALALEAGTAMHEVFAWVRLCQLAYQTFNKYRSEERQAMWEVHGQRVLGNCLWEDIEQQYVPNLDDNFHDYVKRGALLVLENGDFYDDPSDRRRTISNMQECALAYIDRWNFNTNNVWIRNANNLTDDVGIEIPFDLCCNIQLVDYALNFRLTGKIDGIHQQGDRVILHENKTASRLNDAWLMSFYLNTQPTHYMIAASCFTNSRIDTAKILGITIPLPKQHNMGGIVEEVVTRKNYHFDRWTQWLVHTIELYNKYKNNPIDAPKYTHSCNRYFSACSFIPFCDNEDDDQREILSEMITEEWSPLNNG